jgi:hypothetical protein
MQIKDRIDDLSEAHTTISKYCVNSGFGTTAAEDPSGLKPRAYCLALMIYTLECQAEERLIKISRPPKGEALIANTTGEADFLTCFFL